MKKVIDYCCEPSDTGREIDNIRRLISEGWQPLGAPIVQGDYAYQAMVRYDDEVTDLEDIKSALGDIADAIINLNT